MSETLDSFTTLHPADLADRLQRLPAEEARAFLIQLAPSPAAAALAEMEPDFQRELLTDTVPAALRTWLALLPAKTVADLIPRVPPGHRRGALDSLPADSRRAVEALLRYPPDSAGGIMSDRFLTLQVGETLGQCQERLRQRATRRPEDISYLYVTDAQGQLVGVVSVRDLVFSPPGVRVADVMERQVTSVPVDADQETVARLFEHYHYLGLPVVAADGRLVGVVRSSDALQVARKEATEDMQLMVGLSGEERTLTPWRRSVAHRLPWLFLNLLTAFAAAAVVGLFEGTIARWTALAVFLPIIAGQGGNAGMQTLTIIIRDMALGELAPGDARRAVSKEAVLAVINGLAIGLVVGVAGYLWKGSMALGLVAMGAMVLNQLSAALAGVAIPFGLKAVRVDPALASSIFVTTVTDVAGFFFFLGLALLALTYWPVALP